ncbi:MAG: acylneuraminate cytidylyltransferase family protein [Lachnospiraceae bacterium]|nr:acylneuraminate cytidylyltransferase family protein [Lachnospiraceae bacterium]
MAHLAVIPARSGSKGLKDKNIKLMNGNPLMAYTIQAALESGVFDEVFVSTDSAEYAEIAKKYGASVPFLRSEKTSGDTAGSWDVVKEVLEEYRKLGKDFDFVTLLQPTSPLRNAKEIAGAYKMFRQKNARTVVSVCETEDCSLCTNVLPEDMSMTGFIPKDIAHARRQELPDYYRINGAIYTLNVEVMDDVENLYDNGCFAYIMSREHSIDIDTLADFKMAEALMEFENSGDEEIV